MEQEPSNIEQAGVLPAPGGQVRRRRLGRTRMSVSEIGLGGAWLLGRRGGGNLASGERIVNRALELGVNYIDTAECYIGGRSERLVGGGLARAAVARDTYLLATKFGHLPEAFDFSADSVVSSLRRSLKALGVDRVDVLQVHTPPEPPWDLLAGPGGAFAGMRRAKEEGLARFLGVTGADVGFLVRSIDTDLFDTALVFRHFNAVDQSAAAVLRTAVDHDTAVIVGGPLRGGLLGSARDTVRADVAPVFRRRAEAVESLAAESGMSPAELATRFVLTHDAVACSLSGPATVDELEDSLTAAEHGPLPPDLMAAIDEVGGGADA